jgi:hypothetical protein
MNGRLARIWRVIRGDPGLIEVMGIAVEVEINLRRLPLEELLSRATSRGRDTGFVRDLSPETARRTIEVAYRLLPFESTCLKQALVFRETYRRRGLAAELRIGVQKTDNRFAAHAWVEDGAGKVLTDPLEGFNPIPLPAATAIRGDRASG